MLGRASRRIEGCVDFMGLPTTSTTPTSPPDVELRLVSDVRYLAGARELVSGVARRLGFSNDSSAHLALAVDEALCNVIRHGYDRSPGRPIWVRVWPLEDDGEHGPGVRITIEDEAKQVDLARIKGRDLDDVKPGGLGVHIIKQVVDAAEYAHREHGGMRLTLEKRVDGPSARRTREIASGDEDANGSCPTQPEAKER
ncbi:MAG: ATP-binding protein [Planctomycetota bacterium]